jgi:hypothetical protein
MKKLNHLYIIACIVLLAACRKNDGPSVDDHYMNYDIPQVPVDQDYTVGALYYSFGTFNANIKEVPTVGSYSMPSGNITAGIMQKHIDTASNYGLDYFLFQVRSANRDNGNYRNDSVLVRRFVEANTANKMKLAIAYNYSAGSYGISTTSPLENDATKLQQFFSDIERLLPYMQDPNYVKVGGKTLLYIMNAHQLYSNNNVAIYTELRNRLSALGITLYIVGMQDRWTPPARYPFRYKGCVDAIFHQSFVSGINNWDRFYLLPQAIDQNWKYSKAYFRDSMQVDYVPNISPAYNWLILTPTSVNPNVTRADNGTMYRTLCNVAKLNASTDTRLILLDSWNKWDEDTQLEPANSYGDLYLKITKEQFKKPQ